MAEAQTWAEPLLEGDAGVEQTIEMIRQLVDVGLKDPIIRRTAVEIVRQRGVAPYDRAGEVRAIYDWVNSSGAIHFVNDPVEKETLAPAVDILKLGAGDCDEINGILLPTLLGSLGYVTRLVTIASNPDQPETFSHVYPEVQLDGQWIPADAARPGAAFGIPPPVAYRTQIWPLFDAATGLGSYGLNYSPRLAQRYGLGQDGFDQPVADLPPDWLMDQRKKELERRRMEHARREEMLARRQEEARRHAEEIARRRRGLGQDVVVSDVVDSITGGIADLIRAVKQPAGGFDPYASFRTAYTPYSPPAGYQQPVATSADYSGLLTFALIVGGIWLLAPRRGASS